MLQKDLCYTVCQGRLYWRGLFLLFFIVVRSDRREKKMSLFGQLSLEGLGLEAPKKETKKKEVKPAATKKPKEAKKETKPAAKKAETAEVKPLAEDMVLEKGILYCQPLTIDFEKKSVKELREMLKERSFLEADYFEFFSLAEEVVLAALPYSSTVPLTEAVSPEDRLVRFGDSVSVPSDDGSYSMKDLLALFVEAYPHYEGASVIKLADGVYAPLPHKVTLPHLDMVVTLGNKEAIIPMPAEAKTQGDVLKLIDPAFAEIDKLPVKAEMVIVDDKAIPYFFHKKTEEVKVGVAPKAKAEKKVKLPVKLAFTFGIPAVKLTAEDFDGAAEIPMNTIKDMVLEKYSALKDVKTDFCYMQNVPIPDSTETEDVIQVLVYMQGKGAFFPTFDSREDAEAFLDEGGGDAARFRVAGSTDFGKVQQILAGRFVKYPEQALQFTVAEKMPSEILEELVSLFRKAMPLEDAARVYRRKDGTFFVHHLAATRRTRVFVNFQDSDQPKEALTGEAFLFCEAHSHNSMNAFFSGQDFRSSVYPGLYVCIGRLDQKKPEVVCCAQMDWNAIGLNATDVFEI